MLPPPPSHARVRRRWFYYGLSTPFVLAPPPSHAWRWVLCRFVPFRIAATSLACKSEMEVDFYVVSTPFAPPPPPSHARASRRWIFRGFRARSCRRHFPHIQQRVGCGFLWPFDPVRTATTWLFPDALSGHQGISSNGYWVSVRNCPILKLILSD